MCIRDSLCYVCAPSPLQAGVTVGLRSLDDGYYHGLSAEYEAKCNRFCAALSEAGLDPFIPEGAYYVLANTDGLPGETARERAMHILHHTGVASVPGSAFFHGTGGENLVRFCFAKEQSVLDEACEKLQKLRTV